MTLQRLTILPCLTLTLLVSACDLGDKSIGNETGAGDGDGDETGGDGDGDGDTSGDGDADDLPSDGDCGEETTTVITDLEAALPGFDGVAADYITIAEGSYLGDFGWGPNDGPLAMAHADTSSPLTMSVAYEGGEIRLTEREHVGRLPNGDPGGVSCSNLLEIDVSFGFETEDGLFAESFVVPIRVDSHGQFLEPGFYFSLDLSALDGQLSIDDFTYEAGEIEDFILFGNFAEEGVSGTLAMQVLVMDWVGFGIIGEFSADRLP